MVSRNTRRLGLFVGALLGLTTAFFGYQLTAGHVQQLKEAESDTVRLAKAIDEHTALAFDAADGLLRSVKDHVEALDAGANDRPALAALLRREATRLPQVSALAVYDVDGNPVASSAARDAEAGPLRVDSWSRGVAVAPDIQLAARPGSFDRSISISRRLEDGDGRPSGFIAVWLDAPFFESFYRALNIGASGVVSLLARDGALLIRVPAPPENVYGSLAQAPLFAEHLVRAPVGTYRGVYRDGIERITSYRKLDDWPLVIAVGVAVDDALGSWFALLRTYVQVWLLLTVAMAGAAAAVVWRIRHVERLEQITRDRQRAAEARAVQAEQRLRDALGALTDGFILWGPDDRLVAFNAAAVEYDPEAATALRIGERFEDLFRSRVYTGVIPAASGREEAYIAERMARHRAPDGKPIELRLADGRWLRITEHRTREGGIVSLRRDITFDKRLFEETRNAKEAAEHANRVKGEFLAQMSHEFRTPLNAIIGFSELLLTPVGSSSKLELQVEWVKAIHESGAHLLSLINDVLDYAKLEAGETVLNEESVDFAAVLDSCFNMLKPRAQKHKVKLVRAVEPGVGRITVDPRKLKQILINLATNAIKYNRPEGSVTLSAKVQPDGLLIQVADTGSGIPAEALEAVLEPFRQVDNAYNKKHEGTGLGLPLTKRLVELHGGSLTIESTVDVGTTVSVMLPRRCLLDAAA